MSFSFPGLPPISTGDKSCLSKVAWEERLAAAISSLQTLTWCLLGQGQKPLTYVYQEMDAVPTPTPGMQIVLNPGIGFVNAVPVLCITSQTSPAFVPPASTGGLRIDTVAVEATTSTMVIHPGVEVSSPSTPAAPGVASSEELLAYVHHRHGETSILNSDDGTNGYIVDARAL